MLENNINEDIPRIHIPIISQENLDKLSPSYIKKHMKALVRRHSFINEKNYVNNRGIAEREALEWAINLLYMYVKAMNKNEIK